MRPGAPITRRGLAALAVAGSLRGKAATESVQSAPEQPGSDLRQAAARVAAVKIPRRIQPAFRFQP